MKSNPSPVTFVIRKARYRGFAETLFESEMRGMDIRHLLFTGVAMNVCVDSTARDAYFAESWPILIEDTMDHTGPDLTRDATLWFFETKAGGITDTQKVMDLLERTQTLEKSLQIPLASSNVARVRLAPSRSAPVRSALSRRAP